MKKSEKFINDSVFNVNLKYTKLQNETKELFFRCLDEGRSLKYFSKELDKIWGNLDRSFMENDIEEYKQIIHNNNMQLMEIAMPKTEKETKKENSFFDIISAVVVIGYEMKFVKQKEKEYNRSLKSPAYQNDKKEYLKLKVQKYTDGIVPYYVKKTGAVREVPISVYASMVHNTNLTRSAWNEVLNEANRTGQNLFYIPYHNFSCPHCRVYQGKLYTREQVENILLVKAEEQQEDLLHPNCQCLLTPYIPGLTKIEKTGYTDAENDEFYHIRQKALSLTLEKERLNTDKKIYQRLNDFENIDKVNQKRNKINAKLRELKSELPTEELQKQVTAINRNYTSSYYK